jgi:hypothetical protein
MGTRSTLRWGARAVRGRSNVFAGVGHVEPLERRFVLSAAIESALATDATLLAPLAVSPAAAEDDDDDDASDRPGILSTSPGGGQEGVRRDVFIGADLRLPNGPLKISTVSGDHVKLKKASDGSTVKAKVNTSGGGDSIVLQPNKPLAANTEYVFTVSDDVEDVDGADFVRFSMTFKTGSDGGPIDSGKIKFTRSTLDTDTSQPWTGVDVGPDGKLYASTLHGQIHRWTIRSSGKLSGHEAFKPFGSTRRMVTGFAFDPGSTAEDVVLWLSNAESKVSDDTNPWGSKITRVSGDDFSKDRDVVVGIARSTYNHSLNQPSFGPDGALYVQLPGMTSQGAKDNVWGFRGEQLLTAALLRVDVLKITPGEPVDVRTSGGANYDPTDGDAPVTIYATGFRNAYDMVWTADGRLYLADNGSNAGGSVPGTPSNYSGEKVKAISPLGEGQTDHLYRVDPGGYYGHPNPKRGEYVLDGGNPTSGSDNAEVKSYRVGTDPDDNYRGVTFDLGAKNSVNGLIEYQSGAFDGALKGALLGTRYSGGKDVVILTRRPDGSIRDYVKGVSGLTGFDGALDLTEDTRNGNLYVIDHDAKEIFLIKPVGGGGNTSASPSAAAAAAPGGADVTTPPFAPAGGARITVAAADGSLPDEGTPSQADSILDEDDAILR